MAYQRLLFNVEILVYYHASREALYKAGIEASLEEVAAHLLSYAGELCVILEVTEDGKVVGTRMKESKQ